MRLSWPVLLFILVFLLLAGALHAGHETHIVYPGPIDTCLTMQVSMNGRVSTLLIINGRLPETIVEEMEAGKIPRRRFTYSVSSVPYDGKKVPDYICPAQVVTATMTINTYRVKK